VEESDTGKIGEIGTGKIASGIGVVDGEDAGIGGEGR